MSQIEITAPGPLLDCEGNLRRPGYSRRLVQTYARKDVGISPLRLKEWDYYLVSNGRFALALTIADNGYMGLDSISLLELTEGWEITKSPMQVMTLGRKRLPESSEVGNVHSGGKTYSIHFLHPGERRILLAQMADFGEDGSLTARVELDPAPKDSMVIATPFAAPKHFYYNQKINCLRASGYVTYGDRTWTFDPEDSFAVLDWGRGVWTYDNTWYWSSASHLCDGVPFGWNLGYGFGDTSAATENMLFYDGKAHKLGKVGFLIPGEREDGGPRFMEPWQILDDEGRLDLTFTPSLDRKSRSDFRLLRSDQHQVFGTFSGRAVLDDGRELTIRKFPGFAEKVCNKW